MHAKTVSRRSFLTAAIPLFTATKTTLDTPLWRAGAAAVKINPTKSLWMAGYAARTKPSEGVLQDLFVKALALKDESNKTAVLVTSDLLGFSRAVSDRIRIRLHSRYGVSRDKLLL